MCYRFCNGLKNASLGKQCSEIQCHKHLDIETMSKKLTRQLNEHLV